MNNWDTLRYAEYYVNTMGFSVIPIRPEDKRPLIKSWLEYQTRKPTNEEIVKWFKDTNINIGVVTGSISGITVVDIDPDADTYNLGLLLGKSISTPSVTTPRGGKHLYFSYFKDIRNKAGALRAVDVRGDGGYVVAPPSIGVNGEPYKWDGALAQFSPLALPDNFVREIRGVSVPSFEGKRLRKLFTEGHRDEDLFHFANALVRAGMPPTEIAEAVTIMADACEPPFGQKEALEKVRSALDRADRKNRNLTDEVREWIAKFDGYFSTDEIIKGLDIYDKADRNKVYVILNRLKDDKVIEKHGTRRGIFRRIESELESMDWMEADLTEYDVCLPLGLNEFVEVYPNNIIVVAGAPDSGKTAFLMNIVKDNMNQHEVHYFNSEMGTAEFKKRLLNHKDLKLSDWKFNAWSRAGSFADCIKPGAINIIDYVEITDDFCKIAAEFTDIYKKLDGGLAFIGLQKKYGSDLGRGAEFSLEKPRLYLALDSGRIKIIKAKNWRDPSRNPNGLVKEFKLIGGASFIETTGWNKQW